MGNGEELRNYVEALDMSRKYKSVSIVCRDKEITFPEFHSITDRIAAFLIKKGIGIGDVVCVWTEKSEKQVCSIIGVLKAGAAYLCVEKACPQERLDYMLKDSGAKYTITDDNYDEAAEYEYSLADMENVPVPERSDIACVGYTSGSTGTPKIFAYNHQNMIHSGVPYMFNTKNPEIREKCTTVLGITNMTYGLGGIEAYLSIVNEKKLVLLTEEDITSVDAVAEKMEKYRTDLIVMVPSRLNQLLNNERFRNAMRWVKVIITCGEELKQPILDRITSVVSEGTGLYNLYGSSEAMFVTMSENLIGGKVTYGKPQVDSHVYILDDNNEILDVEETGQICIGGNAMFSGTANGRVYLDDSRFVETEKGRLFKTGDYGYLSKDGELCFRGRIDDMVKFHGRRIELQEISSVLNKYEGIRQAVVRVSDDGEGGRQYLCGYYIADVDIDEAVLVAYMRKYLPFYMVPMYFFRLQEFPLTSRGKLDAKQLPKVPKGQHKDFSEAPEDEKEEMICRVFSKVLNYKDVGANESFFHLGGDSLLAMEVGALLSEEGYTLSLIELFDNPTATELAKVIRPLDKKEAGDYGCALTDSMKAEVTRLYGDLRVKMVLKALPGQKKYYQMPSAMQAIYGTTIVNSFTARRSYDEEGFKGRVHALVRKHPCLRSIFYQEDDVYQIILEDMPVDIRFFDISGELGGSYLDDKYMNEQQKEAVNNRIKEISSLEEAVSSFICFKISDDISTFVIKTPHYVCDGIGLEVLKQELVEEKISDREDGYISLRNYLSAVVTDTEKASAFWQSYLQGARAKLLKMKTVDITHKPVLDEKILSFSKADTLALRRWCGERNITLISLLSWGYGKALMEELDREEVLYYQFVSGRAAGVESNSDVVAMLVNGIPVRQKAEDTVEAFQRSVLMGAEYAYLPEQQIWTAARGKATPLPMNDGLHSLIFDRKRPEILYEDAFDQTMAMGNFIELKDDEMTIRFRFDSVVYDPDQYERLSEGMRRYIIGILKQ